MRKLFASILCLLFCFSALVAKSSPDEKTILLAILADDSVISLERYLAAIENLDYDKKQITVYINSFLAYMKESEQLEKWAKNNEGKYAAIILDAAAVQPLPPYTGKSLACVKNKSLSLAKEKRCDYYFTADCNVYLNPCTLKELVAKDKPIVAPLLRPIPEIRDFHSNYFYDVKEDGFYKDNVEYLKLLFRITSGTIKVPLVHSAYLIKTEYVDQLGYLDFTNDPEFIIFGRWARDQGIEQYICNEEDFGVLVHFHEEHPTKEKQARVEQHFSAKGKANFAKATH